MTDHAWTIYERLLFSGTNVGVLAVPPPLISMGVIPKQVMPGMRGRFSIVAGIVKRNKNYTNVIGLDLGIVENNAPFVPEDGQPEVKVSLHAGHPYFKYIISNYQGTQIYKDSGDGKGFLKFDKAIMTTYTDDTALPPSGVAVLWKYKFIYLFGGVEVGKASVTIEILVTGL